MLRLCSSCQGTKPPPAEHFVVGVNYWPRKIGHDLWKRFDIDIVQDDFARLADLGIHLARVFLLWEDFQPKSPSLRGSALAHLLELCDAAAATHLKVELSFFSDHLGKSNRSPAWLLDPERPEVELCGTTTVERKLPHQSCDSDAAPQAYRAAFQFVRGVVRSVGNHPALEAYNLGNLPECFTNAQFGEQASLWFSEQKSAISELDPHHPVLGSLQGGKLAKRGGYRIDQVFEHVDYCTIDRNGLEFAATEQRQEDLSLFICALTMTLTKKPSVLDEWDPLSILCRSDGYAYDTKVANYTQTLLPQLVGLGARGATFFWYADVPQIHITRCDQGLYGMFDDNGKLRPHGKVLGDFARNVARLLPFSTNTQRIKLSADQFYADPGPQLQGLFEEFVHA